MTQRDIASFEQYWKLPVLTLRSTNLNRNGKSDIDSVAPILNYFCDQLWLRDQIFAGRISPSAGNLLTFGQKPVS